MVLRVRSRRRLTGLMGPSIATIIPSAVFDLDATKLASYSGSGQTWANLVPVPSDGSTKTDYDFQLGSGSGSDAADPTFNGSAGASSAYFSTDGADRFLMPGALTNFLKNLPKTTGGTDFWAAISLRYTAAGSAYAIYSNQPTTTSAGVRLIVLATNRLQVIQWGDTAQSATASGSGPLLTDGTDTLVIISRQANGSVTRFWVNNRTKTELSHSFNAGTTDSAGALNILSSPGGGSAMPSGTRIYSFGMGNAYLDDADAAKIFDFYNARHGRVYA